MTPEQLHQLVQGLLAAGCGTAISFLYQLWVDNVDQQPTPLASRVAVAVLCALTPTILYVAGVAFGWWSYDFVTNIADVVGAFMASQLVHGATQLSGKPAKPAGQ
jgi:hypothetical protein